MPWPSLRANREGHRAEGGLDDRALAAAARADPAAFATLYERYLAPVYRYCYLRLGNRQDAEDATARVFLRALHGLAGYRGGLFAAWLFQIARHVLIDAGRGRRPVQALEAAGEPLDRARGPEEAALAAAEGEALRSALAALPPDQRAAVELGLAGWRGEEIAAALGKSAAAVKMDRLRALKRLRGLLDREA